MAPHSSSLPSPHPPLPSSSIAQLRLTDSHIAAPDNKTLEPGTVFDFGVNSECQSGCPEGMYGSCEAIDNCYSCDIGTCTSCPSGSYRAKPGAVSASQCLPCPTGTFNGAEGAAQCDECTAGSFVTLNASDATDGFGTSSGGVACTHCPAGRESTESGSILCSSCSAGESSKAGEACAAW